MEHAVKPIEVTRTYLQMLSPDQLRAADSNASPHLRLDEVRDCLPSFYLYLYSHVGGPHHWTDRLGWTLQETRAHLARPEISLWVLYADGALAGYFELERHPDSSIEIAYFGLMPEFVGRGYGKELLADAVRQAWTSHPNRVWLHTCTLDGPAALPNYLKRGFQPFRQERYETVIEPDEPFSLSDADMKGIIELHHSLSL